MCVFLIHLCSVKPTYLRRWGSITFARMEILSFPSIYRHEETKVTKDFKLERMFPVWPHENLPPVGTRNSTLTVSRFMRKWSVNFQTGSLGMLTTLSTPTFLDLCTLPTGEHNILYCLCKVHGIFSKYHLSSGALNPSFHQVSIFGERTKGFCAHSYISFKGGFLLSYKIQWNTLLPFASKWMNPETMTLSEVNQTEIKLPHDFTHVWNIIF